MAIGAGGGAPMLRVPRALDAAPRCRVISSPLLAEGAAGFAVMVLLWLLVLPGVVVDDAPRDFDAAGGDANGEGVVGRRCVALWCRWR